jgi:uncharacterized protein YeaO (DUF488 family)
MTQVKIKRVYAPKEESDGYRVLVDRLYPRGIKKENLHYDLWAKDIAPSTVLREWSHEAEGDRWEEFRKRYLQELKSSLEVKDFVEKIRRLAVVTLLYSSRNEVENNAVVLQDYLAKQLVP